PRGRASPGASRSKPRGRARPGASRSKPRAAPDPRPPAGTSGPRQAKSLPFIWYTIFQHVWRLPATQGGAPVTDSRLRAERSPRGFRRLLLTSPERHNPLDAALARALRDAFAEDRGELVVLASTGRDVFCAGADMTISETERAEVSGLLYECLEIML